MYVRAEYLKRALGIFSFNEGQWSNKKNYQTALKSVSEFPLYKTLETSRWTTLLKLQDYRKETLNECAFSTCIRFIYKK